MSDLSFYLFHLFHLFHLFYLFVAWGFDYIDPPLIEYLDSLLIGSGSDLDLQTLKVVELRVFIKRQCVDFRRFRIAITA